jgi:hypothetical protein
MIVAGGHAIRRILTALIITTALLVGAAVVATFFLYK